MADENKNAQQAPKFDEDAAVVEQEIGRFPVDKVPQELLDAYHITPEMLAEIKPGTHTVYTYAQVRVGVRKGYILRKVGEAYMVMPTGPRMKEYRGMITLNETGELLWDMLPNAADEAALVHALTEAYEVDEATAQADVRAFMARLRELEIL